MSTPEKVYRPATNEDAQHGLNDIWLGDPIPVTAIPAEPVRISQAVLDAHAQFGGDLADMQRRYETAQPRSLAAGGKRS